MCGWEDALVDRYSFNWYNSTMGSGGVRRILGSCNLLKLAETRLEGCYASQSAWQPYASPTRVFFEALSRMES